MLIEFSKENCSATGERRHAQIKARGLRTGKKMDARVSSNGVHAEEIIRTSLSLKQRRSSNKSPVFTAEAILLLCM